MVKVYEEREVQRWAWWSNGHECVGKIHTKYAGPCTSMSLFLRRCSTAGKLEHTVTYGKASTRPSHSHASYQSSPNNNTAWWNVKVKGSSSNPTSSNNTPHFLRLHCTACLHLPLLYTEFHRPWCLLLSHAPYVLLATL
jgi:hypothetical protein